MPTYKINVTAAVLAPTQAINALKEEFRTSHEQSEQLIASLESVRSRHCSSKSNGWTSGSTTSS
jgi:hypothetical protein